MKTHIHLALTLTLLLAILLAGCTGAATSAGPTSQLPTVSTEAGQTTVPGATSETTASGETSAVVVLGIGDIISAEEIGAILKLTPEQYSDDQPPSEAFRTGTYTFAIKDSSGSQTYLNIGVVRGDKAIAWGYRDPATPRSGSTISEWPVLDLTAYLDTQTYDTEVDGEIRTVVNNYQLICIRGKYYYYLNTGCFANEQVDHFRTSLPSIMEKLIQNAEAKLS
jgi:hypothetical protein